MGTRPVRRRYLRKVRMTNAVETRYYEASLTAICVPVRPVCRCFFFSLFFFFCCINNVYTRHDFTTLTTLGSTTHCLN